MKKVARIIAWIALAVLLILPFFALSGCVGTGEGGRLTPADTAQQLANLDRALQLAREARADYKDWQALTQP